MEYKCNQIFEGILPSCSPCLTCFTCCSSWWILFTSFKYELNTVVILIVVHGHCNPWMIQHMIVVEVMRNEPSDRLVFSRVDGFCVVLKSSIVRILVDLSNKRNWILHECVYYTLSKMKYRFVKRNQLLILNYKCWQMHIGKSRFLLIESEAYKKKKI